MEKSRGTLQNLEAYSNLTSWTDHADQVNITCSNVVSDSGCLYDIWIHSIVVDGYNCRLQVESLEAIDEGFKQDRARQALFLYFLFFFLYLFLFDR